MEGRRKEAGSEGERGTGGERERRERDREIDWGRLKLSEGPVVREKREIGGELD